MARRIRQAVKQLVDGQEAKTAATHRGNDPWGRGSYSIPKGAVAGSSDCGDAPDSPAPTDKVKAELERLRAYLKEQGITSRYKSSQSGNAFMAKRWVCVSDADYDKALELTTAWLAEHEHDTRYIHDVNESKTNEARELSVPEQHQKRIAISTLRMSDVGANIMGGMTKAEARAFLKSKCGWSDERIAELERGDDPPEARGLPLKPPVGKKFRPGDLPRRAGEAKSEAGRGKKMSYANKYEQVAKQYEPKIIELLNRIAADCKELGMNTIGPDEMSDEDSKWSLTVLRPGDTEKSPDAIDRGADVTITIADSQQYEGEAQGVNFTLDAVATPGEIIGQITPFNYTEDVWVDLNDEEALRARFGLIEDDIDDVASSIQEWFEKNPRQKDMPGQQKMPFVERKKQKNEGKITWNTDVNAPGCPGEIVNDDGRTVLIQTDWDYPGTASTFGWSVQEVQTCPSCGKILSGDDTASLKCPACDAELKICDHGGTDGTVDCKQCGVTATDFITAAGNYLEDNDGMTADDPGYFSESKKEEADVTVSGGGTTWLVTPHTPEAEEWIEQNVNVEDYQRLGYGIVVEHGYIEEIVAAMKDAGLTVVEERDEGVEEAQDINALKAQAARAAKQRGHRLGKWKAGARPTEQQADCTTDGCDAWVAVDSSPLPNGINIGGPAVAVDCPAKEPENMFDKKPVESKPVTAALQENTGRQATIWLNDADTATATPEERQESCGRCHTCGEKLAKDKEADGEYCKACDAIRRYESHGCVGGMDATWTGPCPQWVKDNPDAAHEAKPVGKSDADKIKDTPVAGEDEWEGPGENEKV